MPRRVDLPLFELRGEGQVLPRRQANVLALVHRGCLLDRVCGDAVVARDLVEFDRRQLARMRDAETLFVIDGGFDSDGHRCAEASRLGGRFARLQHLMQQQLGGLVRLLVDGIGEQAGKQRRRLAQLCRCALDVGAGIEGVGEVLDIVGVVGQVRIGCGFARRHFGIRLHPGQGGRQLARVWAHGDRADGECRELRGVHGVNALYRGHHLHEYAVWHHAQFVLELADRVLHGGTQRVLADFAITARLCPWPLAQQQIRRCRGAIEAWHLVDVAFP